jgi:hypothetical protein
MRNIVRQIGMKKGDEKSRVYGEILQCDSRSFKFLVA